MAGQDGAASHIKVNPTKSKPPGVEDENDDEDEDDSLNPLI